MENSVGKDIPISDFLNKNEESSPNIKIIHLLDNQFVIKNKSEELISDPFQNPTDKLAGVYIEGVQYYDLSNIHFINNSGIAKLIDLLKSLLKEGVEVQFVNVDSNIKKKIRSMGLDHVLDCC